MSTTLPTLAAFGGRFVPEALWAPLAEVEAAYNAATADPSFSREFETWIDRRIGRPTPVSKLERLSADLGRAELLAKREDLCLGHSFCANAAVLYGLLARRLGREVLVAESASGDFGVALASIGRAMGLGVRVFMGRADREAQALKVARMRALGVEVVQVDSAQRGRRLAAAESLRWWADHHSEALYCASTLAAPSPYPHMLAQALSVIGNETRLQCERLGGLPDVVIAPVGGGAFAAGLFGAFLGDGLDLVGVEGGGDGATHAAAPLGRGRPGVLHGCYSYTLLDDRGQVLSPHSVAPGLCVAQVGPQHARWALEGAVRYVSVLDDEALEARARLAHSEGLVVSTETAHAVAYALKLLPQLEPGARVVVGFSGEGSAEVADIEAPQVGSV